MAEQNNGDKKVDVEFQSGAHKPVSVKQESLDKARELVRDIQEDDPLLVVVSTSNEDASSSSLPPPSAKFETASHKPVKVSKDSLDKAKKLIREVGDQVESELREKQKVEKKGAGAGESPTNSEIQAKVMNIKTRLRTASKFFNSPKKEKNAEKTLEIKTADQDRVDLDEGAKALISVLSELSQHHPKVCCCSHLFEWIDCRY